jgi:lysozyme
MTIKGIDVSHHNGPIDWKKVKADGISFVFIKATQGTGYSKVDYFRNQAPKALGYGLHVGAYHYAVFSNIPEAISEAQYFLSVIKDYKLTYPPVLDLEENKENASKKQLTDAAIAFLDVLKHAGYSPILYTGKSFLSSELDESRIKYPLWIARYNDDLGRKADIWQYSSTGKVDGINGNVDMNIAYRDFAPKPKKKTDPFPGKLIKEGSKGKHVEKVQKKVGAKADGVFGPKTEAAVKAYQKKHKLKVDGVVGPISWKKMF